MWQIAPHGKIVVSLCGAIAMNEEELAVKNSGVGEIKLPVPLNKFCATEKEEIKCLPTELKTTPPVKPKFESPESTKCPGGVCTLRWHPLKQIA